jgi:hypothetical protein
MPLIYIGMTNDLSKYTYVNDNLNLVNLKTTSHNMHIIVILLHKCSLP